MTSTEQAAQVDGDGASTIPMAHTFPNSTLGFTRLRRVAETPLNVVYGARP
jgi:hypothetical protein